MPEYSTSPFVPGSSEDYDITHIPWVAHIRVVPRSNSGNRWELYRAIEKIALRVEQDLVAAQFNIATPIAFTPQIGDYSARLTVVGFNPRNVSTGRQNTAPTTNIDLIHSGTNPGEKTAPIDGNRGGSLSEGQDPVAAVDAEVAALRAALAAASTHFEVNDVIHIEYNGVKYGVKKQGGRSFPH